MKYYSQDACQQDKKVDKFFNYKCNGYFMDIGCSHYSGGNNTYFFEKNRNWKGICVDILIIVNHIKKIVLTLFSFMVR